jgi:hypothetical protein
MSIRSTHTSLKTLVAAAIVLAVVAVHTIAAHPGVLTPDEKAQIEASKVGIVGMPGPAAPEEA